MSQIVFNIQTLCLKLNSSKSFPSTSASSGKIFQNSGSTPIASKTWKYANTVSFERLDNAISRDKNINTHFYRISTLGLVDSKPTFQFVCQNVCPELVRHRRYFAKFGFRDRRWTDGRWSNRWQVVNIRIKQLYFTKSYIS